MPCCSQSTKYMYNKTCQCDHSDKATTCPKRPLQLRLRDVISSQMTLIICTRGPHFEGPLSGRLTQVSVYCDIVQLYFNNRRKKLASFVKVLRQLEAR